MADTLTLASITLAVLLGLLALRLWSVLRATRRDRDEFHGLLVSNYEAYVRGLRGVLEDRKRLCEQVSKGLTSVPAHERARAEIVNQRLAAGMTEVGESLTRQLRGEQRLAFEIELFHRELKAGDETLAQIADLLVHSVPTEEKQKVQREYTEYRAESEKEKATLKGEVTQLREEKKDLEVRISTMADPEEMEKAQRLVEEMEQEIQEIESCLVDDEGAMQAELSEERIGAMEQQMAAVDESLQSLEQEISGEGENVGGREKHRRLRRIRRAVLDRLIRRHRAEKRATTLEERVGELSSIENGDVPVTEEIERMAASKEQLKHAVRQSRDQLQAMTDHIRKLESMEETSQRVRQELRNLGIINLELQRQVEEMEHSQVLYERALRSLSKLNAELEGRDRRITEMQSVIETNDQEIHRLQEEIERLRQGGGDAQARPEAGAEGKSPDITVLRGSLKFKLEETTALRGQVKGLESEVEAKQSQIDSLEQELNHLAVEYQKLFKEIPLRR
jgi:chromosome segregation ATPase